MLTRLLRKNRRLFTVIVTVLGLCVAFASTLMYSIQKAQLEESLMRKTERDVDLIGTALTDAMLRHDYSEGRRLLDEWRNIHSDVVRLNVAFENGQMLFVHEAETNGDTLVTRSKPFRYANRTLTVTMAHNASQALETLEQLKFNLFVLSAFLIVLMGLTLWFVLFRWMIAPMEEEIATRTRELQIAKDTLEDQVRDRTNSLTQEIESRQEAESTLRKLVRAVEQSPVIIFITNTAGVIEYVNPKFEEVTGYSRDEAIGQTPSILKSPDTPRSVHLDLWKTILAGREWINEIQDRCKDGSVFWANVHISPIRDTDGAITHFVALHENITERKAAETAMRDARRAAELANKAKTDIMANMSHELRTPLNAIIGFSETMKHSVFGPLGSPQYMEYADYIHSSGTHLLQLINDILDVSSVDAGKLRLKEEPSDVAELCAAAARIVSPKAAETGVAIHPIATRNLPLLMADPLRIKQIFINLISNAVKFTPKGGTVMCDADITDNGDMVVTVTDTGIGMDKEGLAKALEKFGQVDSSLSRKHEGTGLGLPLTKGLTELHDGAMEIDSAPGHGTTVTLTFPAVRVLGGT